MKKKRYEFILTLTLVGAASMAAAKAMLDIMRVVDKYDVEKILVETLKKDEKTETGPIPAEKK